VLTVLAGPTASGKSALALELARTTGAELISADSQQVYRYFDLGTAKPSADELAAAPHHLVSCVEPMEAFSAARFATLADQAISDIQARGKRVIVVGGTGLYLRVLLHGVVNTPGRDEALRAQLEALADLHGNAALHAELAKVDPASAAQLHAADRVRVIRALEITQLTGQPASVWREAHAFEHDRYPYSLWVLDPPREALYARINARARAMFDGGLLEETASLVKRGFRDAAPMKAVGYAQALDCLEGRLTREAAIEETAKATRHYAKRQWTWFKKERGARLLAPPYRVELGELSG
jgi:tRNA dimethylallyltransferase